MRLAYASMHMHIWSGLDRTHVHVLKNNMHLGVKRVTVFSEFVHSKINQR